MKRYRTDPAAYPTIPFDLVKEAVLSGALIAVLVVGAALVFGAPYVKPVTIQGVARTQPVLFLRTAARDLGNRSAIAQFGPPYNHGTAGVQSIGFLHPQTLLGVTTPIHPPTTDVLAPLRMATPLDPALGAALQRWTRAGARQQQAWVTAYLAALPRATVAHGAVAIPAATDGPVPALLTALRQLAVGGLMSGALDRATPSGAGAPPNTLYRYDVAPTLLFLQGQALHQQAKRYDLLGEQWGIMHDEQSYPGPWWLTPYTFLYQIPPYSTSPAGDMMAAYTMLVVFLVLIALPWIPGLRGLPRRLRVYRVIWRDWYRAVEGPGDGSRMPARLLRQRPSEQEG